MDKVWALMGLYLVLYSAKNNLKSSESNINEVNKSQWTEQKFSQYVIWGKKASTVVLSLTLMYTTRNKYIFSIVSNKSNYINYINLMNKGSHLRLWK